MPHYFFHLLHPDRDPVRDDEGMAFEDDAAAKREAILSLGEMIKEASFSEPVPFCVSIQVIRQGVGVIYLITGQLGPQAQPG